MLRTDAILILGHRLGPGDRPSDDLIRRIDCAVEYRKSTNAPIIMLCAQSGMSEAEIIHWTING